MDGCVSKPVESAAMLATVRAAAPQHGRPAPERVSAAAGAGAGKKRGPKAFKMGVLGTLEGAPGSKLGSSACAVPQPVKTAQLDARIMFHF